MRIGTHCHNLIPYSGRHAQIGNSNFLNCTKNTELTPLDFARTFSFALARKSSWSQPRFRFEDEVPPAIIRVIAP